jgi:hypothetical protein
MENLEELVSCRLSEIDPDYIEELELVESEFGCKIKVDTAKHDVLNYTHYYECDFGHRGVLYVEIESGINNGTVILSSGFGVNTKPKSKTVDVLVDVVIDATMYDNPGVLKKAKAMLSANKHKFFEWHRKNSYDNYVTGGNSKLKIDDHLSRLHVEFIYKEKEVDINWV